MRASAGILILLFSLSRFCSGDDNGVLFFEKHIRPALIDNCYECHSAKVKKPKGGLRLDSKRGWETGGDIGPAVTPGNIDKSLLLRAIRHEDPDLEMPPKKRLSDDVVKKFEQWIAMGAPDPRVYPVRSGSVQGTLDQSSEAAREFWSFQPRKYEIPTNTKSAKTVIDRFIEAKLSDQGITKAALAPAEARLRRAKTDLTGLPLTIAEQEEFLSDPSTEKWELMIDRWLASEGFGERWGRHWLDLARYADTSGGGRAMALPEAWKFRDFVIEAFNDDMPLDHLMLSHVAGDLLPYQNHDERAKNLTSTGFLVLGPHNYENQNKDLLELEIADEQLDTLGRSFLGMTIGCARCHDHKFDPIPTKDYYSMAGIFLSSNSVTHSNVSKWHLEPLPGSAEIQEQLRLHQERQIELQAIAIAAKLKLEEAGGDPGRLNKAADKESLAGIVLDDTDANLIGKWVPSQFNKRYVAAGYLHDNHGGSDKMTAIFSTPVSKAGTYEVRFSYAAGPNRSTKTPVTVSAGSHSETLRINQRKMPEFQSLFTRLGNYYVEKDETITVAIANDPNTSDGCVVVDAVQILPYDPKITPDIAIIALNKEYEQSQKALTNHGKKKPKVPSVMAIGEHEGDKIKDTPIRIRGDDDTPGEMAPRGFLEVASWKPNSIPKGRSGRLELGRWIVDHKHPLTARVMANRIWLHLVGEGLVRTPDNFGTTGQLPTHPELLDYLAQKLIDCGWSTKALIKEIMLSDVYQFDSEVDNPKAAKLDPGNLYLWRANRRPLEVEVLRDGMLRVAGTMDMNRGGTSLPPGFKSEFGYQFTTRKRSVYLPVFRNTGHEMFSLFDFANPNFTVGKRGRSAVPTQALYLLNSEEVHRYATEAASQLLQSPGTDFEDRFVLAFRQTIGRKPSSEEKQWGREQFAAPADHDDAEKWAALYRMLFASLDFRFLR